MSRARFTGPPGHAQPVDNARLARRHLAGLVRRARTLRCRRGSCDLCLRLPITRSFVRSGRCKYGLVLCSRTWRSVFSPRINICKYESRPKHSRVARARAEWRLEVARYCCQPAPLSWLLPMSETRHWWTRLRCTFSGESQIA